MSVRDVCTVNYLLTVVTGTANDDAGTDADVFITMFGDAGVCEDNELDNIAVDDFEYGA